MNLYAYAGNDPVNLVDPLGLFVLSPFDISPMFVPFDVPRSPDYFTFSFNKAIYGEGLWKFFGGTGQITVDRYGNVYFGLGGNFGKAWTDISGSFVAGWKNQCSKPTEDEMQNFLTDWALNGGVGRWFGGGLNWSPGNGTSFESGFVSPQAGVAAIHSWKILDLPIQW